MAQRRNMTMSEFKRELDSDTHNSIFHIDFIGNGDEVVTPEQQDKYKEQLAKLDKLTHINHKEKAND